MKILIGYDGSECAQGIFDDLPRAGLPQDIEALVISVDELWLPLPPSYGMAETGFPLDFKATAEVEGLAKQGAERMRSLFPACAASSEGFAGSPSSSILARADEWQPDLIVVGSHGRSALGRFLLGSVSQRLATEAGCSVRISRGRAGRVGTTVRIVVGIDGSPGCEAAVSELAARSWPAGTEARLISVLKVPIPAALESTTSPAVQMVDEVKEEYVAELERSLEVAAGKLRAVGLAVSNAVKTGDPKRVLLDAAEQCKADSIFVGARGLSRFKRLMLGSVSAALAARAHCSVEVVRPRPAR